MCAITVTPAGVYGYFDIFYNRMYYDEQNKFGLYGDDLLTRKGPNLPILNELSEEEFFQERVHSMMHIHFAMLKMK